MLIRNIRKNDYEAVDRLLLQLHEVDVKARPELFREKAHFMPRDTFDSLVENDEVITILAEKQGQALGCCFVSMMNVSGMVKMKTACIDLIVVDAACRRKGIGKALFQSVRKRARKAGARRVDLMVWSHNEPAMRAYESYGMVPQRCIYEKQI